MWQRPWWLGRNDTAVMSGAIPRFPVWEVTALALIALAGLQGLLTPTPSRMVELLGGWNTAWYGALIACGVGGLVGMTMRVPGGLLLSLASAAGLFVAITAVAAALVVLTDQVWFPGATSFYVFLVGSAARAMQLLRQLRRLNAELRTLPDRGEPA